MNHLEKTQATYQQIATAYAQAQQNRDRMAEQMKRFVVLLPPGGLVLDVGCGPGMDTAVLQSYHFNAIGLDFSHEMMRVGRDEYGVQVPFVQTDMRHLPGGQQAAGIWACASLLHLPRHDVLPTLHEFWRVLKPGGVLYLSLKLGNGEEWVPAEKYDQSLPRFFTYWQPETLDPLLETAAFHIIDGWQEQGERDTWMVRYGRKIVPRKGEGA